jgi:tetrahydromethanopterin S-methyltransferase subunit E
VEYQCLESAIARDILLHDEKQYHSVQQAKRLGNLHCIFQRPLSDEAFQQYLLLTVSSTAYLVIRKMIYARTFGGMKLFLVHKAYMALT